MEGGHYTFVEAHTDQMGESRLDRNVKKFFVQLHTQVDARFLVLRLAGVVIETRFQILDFGFAIK